MNIKEQFIKQLPRFAVIMAWGIACFCFFQTQYKYHFFYEEQNQLFLMEWEYIQQYFSKPAWMACLIGDFLTQFYFYLFAGPIIITGVLLVLGDLLRRDLERQVARSFMKRFSETARQWGCMLVAIVVISIVARMYLSESYHLSGVITLCGGAVAWYIHNIVGCRLKKWWLRLLLLIPTLLLTYWMFGNGAIVVAIIEMLNVWFIPTMAVSALVGFGIAKCAESSYHLTPDASLLYPGVGKWVDMDYARIAERNLQIDNEYYFGNYAKVMQLYEEQVDEATDEMTFYYSLALAQMNMLPEKLTTMKKPFLGTFLTIGEDTPMYNIKMINDLYWVIGDMTYTERAALLANTFSPNGRNARMMKRLAEVNLVSGDKAAATKYLRLLEKTIVYRQWAKDHTPDALSTPVKMEIENKQQFVNKTDNIRLGDSCYIILTQLLDSNPDNMIALDYLLCSDMLAQQKETFVEDYDKYDGSRREVFEQVYEEIRK